MWSLTERAGIEQINRRVMEKVTHLLLISDTSKKGLEVIKTIENVAMELVKYDRIGLIVNRVEDPAMIERLDTRGLELFGSDPVRQKNWHCMILKDAALWSFQKNHLW